MAGRFLAWLEGLRMLLRNIAVTCLPNDDSLKRSEARREG